MICAVLRKQKCRIAHTVSRFPPFTKKKGASLPVKLSQLDVIIEWLCLTKTGPLDEVFCPTPRHWLKYTRDFLFVNFSSGAPLLPWGT